MISSMAPSEMRSFGVCISMSVIVVIMIGSWGIAWCESSPLDLWKEADQTRWGERPVQKVLL